jgi:hypothetical protein
MSIGPETIKDASRRGRCARCVSPDADLLRDAATHRDIRPGIGGEMSSEASAIVRVVRGVEWIPVAVVAAASEAEDDSSSALAVYDRCLEVRLPDQDRRRRRRAARGA